MEKEKLKILYVAGSGRSGSTILQNILGQIDGFYSVGELRSVWDRSFMKNQLCGCGRAFHECDWWKAVMQQAPDLFANADARQMYQWTESFRIHNLPPTLIPSIRDREIARLDVYLRTLEKLYRAIQAATGCRVIVDDSKNPAYGYLVSQLPSVDLYVLHFIRDPRAVAYSWTKKKAFFPGPNPEYMAQKGAVKSILQWYARNLGTEVWLRPAHGKYLQLKYEDFVYDPRRTVEQILEFLEEKAGNLPFVSDQTVEIKNPNHSVFGNLVRFQTGMVDIRADMEWKKKMSRSKRAAITVFALPLMLKYGYVGAEEGRT